MEANDKNSLPAWFLFRGTGKPHGAVKNLPPPPPWRQFTDESREKRGEAIQVDLNEIEMVNAALYLRRPLLVTGKPGTGKTSLAYAVARELGLGSPLIWPIGTRSTVRDGLYRYDAVGRLQQGEAERQRVSLNKRETGKDGGAGQALQEADAARSTPGGELAEAGSDIGRYVRLGPLGTALLPSENPRVLLIDEIDKSDIDLPNELLHVFEEGEFEIPELARLPKNQSTVYVRPSDDGPLVPIIQGRVRCSAFPLVFLTSNGEREFPPAFLRRCLRLKLELPGEEKLMQIVEALYKLDGGQRTAILELVKAFLDDRDTKMRDLATDQLLNAVYLTLHQIDPLERERQLLRDTIWKSLSESVSPE